MYRRIKIAKKPLVILSLFLVFLFYPSLSLGQEMSCNLNFNSEEILHNPYYPIVDNQREIRIGRVTDLALDQIDDTIDKASSFLQKTREVLRNLEGFYDTTRDIKKFCPIENCISSCKKETSISCSTEPGPGVCFCSTQGLFCNGTTVSTGDCYSAYCQNCPTFPGSPPSCLISLQPQCRLIEEEQCQITKERREEGYTFVCHLEKTISQVNNINILGRTGSNSLQSLLWQMKKHFLPRYLPYVYYSRVYGVGDLAGLLGYLGDTAPLVLREAATKVDNSLFRERSDPGFALCLYPTLFFTEEGKERFRTGFSQCLSEREFDILRELEKERKRIFGGGDKGIERTGCWQRERGKAQDMIIACSELMKNYIIPQASFFGTEIDKNKIIPLAKGCYGGDYLCDRKEGCSNDYYCCTITLE